MLSVVHTVHTVHTISGTYNTGPAPFTLDRPNRASVRLSESLSLSLPLSPSLISLVVSRSPPPLESAAAPFIRAIDCPNLKILSPTHTIVCVCVSHPSPLPPPSPKKKAPKSPRSLLVSRTSFFLRPSPDSLPFPYPIPYPPPSPYITLIPLYPLYDLILAHVDG